jgi:hypothetical protein
MGRYDSHKFPFTYNMNQWSSKRINTRLEREAKSIPCHVTKVEKDFITVAFETQNGIFTPPTVKIPQSMSQYGRNPTQVGDKGYGVPGNYYLGGVTGDAGGNTDFYPRGNLTTLSFEHTSHKQNPDRDVDQLTHMGGPNGWTVGPFKKQQQDQQTQQSQNGSAAAASTFFRTTNSFRAQQSRLRQAVPRDPAGGTGGNTGGGGTSGSGSSTGQQQQDDDKTQFSFDKNGKAVVNSKDAEHSMVVDKQNDHAHLSVTIGGKAYIGGDGSKGQYAAVMTEKGPSKNSFARIG